MEVQLTSDQLAKLTRMAAEQARRVERRAIASYIFRRADVAQTVGSRNEAISLRVSQVPQRQRSAKPYLARQIWVIGLA
jgi:hypothetical protein